PAGTTGAAERVRAPAGPRADASAALAGVGVRASVAVVAGHPVRNRRPDRADAAPRGQVGAQRCAPALGRGAGAFAADPVDAEPARAVSRVAARVAKWAARRRDGRAGANAAKTFVAGG